MSLLALDLATRCGWALAGEPIAYGVADFRPDRFSGAGMVFLRFSRFLDDLHAQRTVTEIVYEAVHRHAGTAAAHRYGGFVATLQAWAEARGIPYEGLGVGEIKRAWTGRGNADKAAMIEAAHARGFANVDDDNIADALAVLSLAQERRR